MATETEIAVLAAKLKVDGGDQFRGEMERSTAKVDALGKHLQRLKDQVAAVGKTPVKLEMRGAEAYAGKLQMLNKSAFVAGESVTRAGQSTVAAGAAMSLSMGNVQQAARGLGGALGGLGSLGPIVSALASPAGIAASAIGGMVLVIKKLREEIAELDKMDFAGTLDEMARAGAGRDAAAQALISGIATGKSGKELDLLVAQAEKTGELSHEVSAAAKAVAGYRKEQEALVAAMRPSQDALAEWQAKLTALENVADKRSLTIRNRLEIAQGRVKKYTDALGAQEGTFASLTAKIDATWGAVKNHAKETGGATTRTNAYTEALKRAAAEAKRLHEEMEKVSEAAADTLQGVLSSVAAGFTAKRPPRGTAASYVDMFGPLIDALENATEAYKKATPSMDIRPSLAAGIGGPTGAVIQGAQAGGAPGAILALFMQSEQFGKAVEIMNEHVLRIANVLGAVIEPALPILRDVVDGFKPLLEVARPLVSLYMAMNPVMIVAARAAAIFADTVTMATRMFSGTVLGILKAIRKALDKMGISFKPLDDTISSLKKSMKDLGKTADDTAAALGAIMPEGYKLLEYRRYNAQPGQQVYYGPSGTTTGGGISPTGTPTGQSGNAASGGGVGSFAGATFILQGVQTESELWRKLKGIDRREQTIRTGRAAYSSGGA